MTSPTSTASASPVRRQWRGGASPVKRAFIVDRRKRPARRLVALTSSLCDRLGRPLGELDELERSRVAMAAHLMLVGEEMHARAASGRAVEADELVRLSGALSRLLDDLGLSPAALERRRQEEAEARRIAELRAMGVNYKAP